MNIYRLQKKKKRNHFIVQVYLRTCCIVNTITDENNSRNSKKKDFTSEIRGERGRGCMSFCWYSTINTLVTSKCMQILKKKKRKIKLLQLKTNYLHCVGIYGAKMCTQRHALSFEGICPGWVRVDPIFVVVSRRCTAGTADTVAATFFSDLSRQGCTTAAFRSPSLSTHF